MASLGSLPTTSIYSTWSENVEVFSIDDDTLYDFSGITEITLKLQDPLTRFDELTLTMSGGGISLPAPGVIQWRAEKGLMGTLSPKTYKAILLLEDDTDTVALILGPVSVVE
jgi:hypothetical protein